MSGEGDGGGDAPSSSPSSSDDHPDDLAPGPEWAPFVSIHPPELNFGQTPLCTLNKAYITVFNTHAEESLMLISLTTDRIAFQPTKFMYNKKNF